MTTYLKTNYDAKTNTSDVEKSRNRTSQIKQTTRNWIERILNEVT